MSHPNRSGTHCVIGSSNHTPAPGWKKGALPGTGCPSPRSTHCELYMCACVPVYMCACVIDDTPVCISVGCTWSTHPRPQTVPNKKHPARRRAWHARCHTCTDAWGLVRPKRGGRREAGACAVCAAHATSPPSHSPAADPSGRVAACARLQQVPRGGEGRGVWGTAGPAARHARPAQGHGAHARLHGTMCARQLHVCMHMNEAGLGKRVLQA